MSTSSDQTTGYLSGIIAGFASLCIFAALSVVLFIFVDTKTPTDRTYEGDFTAERVAMRSSVGALVKAEQVAGLDQEKLASAMASVKAAPEAASSIAVPGSPTALKAMEPKAPSPPAAVEPAKEKPAVESDPVAKPKPAAKPKPKATPKPKPVVEPVSAPKPAVVEPTKTAVESLGNQPDEGVKGKGKAKSKSNGAAKGEPKGKPKAKGKGQPKGNGGESVSQ